jgi:hypothetical protein
VQWNIRQTDRGSRRIRKQRRKGKRGDGGSEGGRGSEGGKIALRVGRDLGEGIKKTVSHGKGKEEEEMK